MKKQLDPNKLRQHVLNMVYNKKSGHIGGSFSIAELIACLYTDFNLHTDNVENDTLVLSKGHAVPIVYAALLEKGILTQEDLDTFREVDSQLQGHPDKLRLSSMHATTGSLGQGLSIAIGHALGKKQRGYVSKVFCILGDGEMQEGQIWEALMLAPKYELGNLTCVIDYNGAQNDGLVKDILDLGDLDTKISSFGWHVVNVTHGHNMVEIRRALHASIARPQIPTCIILNTIKGKGVSFMETPEWHAKVPSDKEYNQAMEELCESD